MRLTGLEAQQHGLCEAGAWPLYLLILATAAGMQQPGDLQKATSGMAVDQPSTLPARVPRFAERAVYCVWMYTVVYVHLARQGAGPLFSGLHVVQVGVVSLHNSIMQTAEGAASAAGWHVLWLWLGDRQCRREAGRGEGGSREPVLQIRYLTVHGQSARHCDEQDLQVHRLLRAQPAYLVLPASPTTTAAAATALPMQFAGQQLVGRPEGAMQWPLLCIQAGFAGDV
jgi:hypothetical protein